MNSKYLFFFLLGEFSGSMILGLILGTYCRTQGISFLNALPVIFAWAFGIGLLRKHLFNRKQSD